MPVKVDNILQNASVIDFAMGNHMDVLNTRGDGQKKRDALKAAIRNLISLNGAQMNAQNFMERKTHEQDELLKQAGGLVAQIQNSAKSAARDKGNNVNLKMFKVGMDKPRSVKGMTALLDYFSDVVVQYHDILIANGMSEEDIASVLELYASLIAVDATQENAKKLRSAATARRNEAAVELQRMLAGIRNYATTVFKGNNAALEEFKPIPKGRGKAKKPAVPPQGK